VRLSQIVQSSVELLLCLFTSGLSWNRNHKCAASTMVIDLAPTVLLPSFCAFLMVFLFSFFVAVVIISLQSR